MVWELSVHLTSVDLAHDQIEIPEGDPDAVRPKDLTPDDGSLRSRVYVGRCADEGPLPKRLLVKAKKYVPHDFLAVGGLYLAGEKMRRVIEELEPGVHQFVPVKMIRKRTGEEIGTWYWFFPCNRLDTISRTASENFELAYNPVTRIHFWRRKDKEKPEKVVFSRPRIGDHHIWVDKYYGGPFIFMSNALYKSLKKARVTGVNWDHLEEFPETDEL